MTSGCCFIDGIHFGLEFITLLVAEGRGGLFLPRELDPLSNYWHWVFRAHTVMGVIRDQSRLFPACVMAGMVAVDDTSGLPELNLVQELAPTESDFAYE